MEMMQFKGYQGSVEVSLDDGILHGKLLFVNDLVTYEAETLAELRTAFEESVNDYLETCAEIGKEPEQAFSGQFNVRVGADLHRLAAIRAARDDIKLNAVVVAALEQYLDDSVQVVHQHHHKHDHQISVHMEMDQFATAVATAQQPYQVIDFNHERNRRLHA